MKLIICLSSALLAATLFLLPGCKGKQEEPEKESVKKDEAVRQEKLVLEQPQMGPHSATDIIKWVKETEGKTDPGILMKVIPFAKKFTVGEIVAGIALRPVPDYWNKISESDRIKTLSIMNTNFSKVRTEAGLAEKVKELNSTLYLEDGQGNIVAVSDPERGAHVMGSP